MKNVEIDINILNTGNKVIEDTIQKLSGDVLNLEETDTIAENLISIYSNGYRHQYSKITADILHLERKHENKEDPKIDNGRPIDWIVQNIEILRDRYLEKIKDKTDKADLEKNFFKLFDHIMLEQSRLEEIHRIYDPLEEKMKNADTLINDISQKANRTRKKLEKSQIEIVTILGIFASIVISFSGAISFTNSVFSSLNGDAAIDNLIICICLCGVLAVNLFAVLIKAISKIIFTEKEIKIYSWEIIILDILLLAIACIMYFKVIK